MGGKERERVRVGEKRLLRFLNRRKRNTEKGETKGWKVNFKERERVHQLRVNGGFERRLTVSVLLKGFILSLYREIVSLYEREKEREKERRERLR